MQQQSQLKFAEKTPKKLMKKYCGQKFHTSKSINYKLFNLDNVEKAEQTVVLNEVWYLSSVVPNHVPYHFGKPVGPVPQGLGLSRASKLSKLQCPRENTKNLNTKVLGTY